MKISCDNRLNFKGYDATIPLKGLFVTDNACARQLGNIIKRAGVDVYTPEIASKSIRKEYFQLINTDRLLWSQDYFTFSGCKVIYDGTTLIDITDTTATAADVLTGKIFIQQVVLLKRELRNLMFQQHGLEQRIMNFLKNLHGVQK